MEQRRVLLIIVSVTIILAAIVGVGIWLFYPRGEAEPDQLTEADGGLEWEPLDYLRGDDELPGLESGAEEPDDDDEFVVTYGVVEDQDERDGADEGFVTETPPGDETTTSEDADVDRPAPADEPSPDDRAAERADAEPAVAEPAERAGEPQPVETAARQRAPSARPPAEPAPADEELADRAYWVQVISSPNHDTVEMAQQTLREHQLGSRVLTKEIGGTLYFRLRLGPFAVREEAEKFLGWVIGIDGFADSMIFVDYTTAVLAARAQ
ncbi:MAG: SPOR domain-containing protein [Spirochaetota bacterium]